MTYQELEEKAVNISYEFVRFGYGYTTIPFILSEEEYKTTINDVLTNGDVGRVEARPTSIVLQLLNGVDVMLILDPKETPLTEDFFTQYPQATLVYFKEYTEEVVV